MFSNMVKVYQKKERELIVQIKGGAIETPFLEMQIKIIIISLILASIKTFPSVLSSEVTILYSLHIHINQNPLQFTSSLFFFLSYFLFIPFLLLKTYINTVKFILLILPGFVFLYYAYQLHKTVLFPFVMNLSTFLSQ